MADQHIELDRPARQQKRHIARQRGIRRQHARGGMHRLAAQRRKPVAEGQRKKQQDKRHADPAERERGIRAGKIGLVQRERHFQRFMILQPRRNHTRDARFGNVQIDIVGDHVAVIPARKGRIALKRLGHGDGKHVFGDGIAPFRAHQRQRERLHAVCLAGKARDRIHDRERARPGKAVRVGQHKHGAVAVGLLLRVVARDGGLFRARAERKAQLRLRAADLQRKALRDLTGTAAGQGAVCFHFGNNGLRRANARAERQQARQQKQQPRHTITSRVQFLSIYHKRAQFATIAAAADGPIRFPSEFPAPASCRSQTARAPLPRQAAAHSRAAG